MLLLSQNIIDNSYDGVTEKIKKDLKEKGIHVSEILIDMNSGNINMKVCLSSLLNQWNLQRPTD